MLNTIKWSVIIFAAFFFIKDVHAQAPGIVIQTGLTAMTSKDKTITKDGEMHYGWVLGADARILEGDLYFIIGGQYVSTSLRSSKAPEFFVKRDWKILNGRCGLGFNIFRISEKISLRSKLLGSVNFIVDAPRNGINIPDYILNDSYLGAVTGVGATIGMIDLDLEYQYGILNAYTKQPDTKFGGWTLLAGFHF